MMPKPVKLLFILPFLFLSCNEDKGSGSTEPDTFDRGEMLAHWADNIIIPSFENFADFTQILQEKTVAFTADPTEANLMALREAYEQAYIQFQTVSLYEIGKAGMINYRTRLNTYPTDAAAIQENTAANDFNLELPTSFDEQGFPALDFLLNGLAETDTEIVDFYENNDNEAAYRDYLESVSENIDTLTNEVLAHWKNGYRDVFVSNTSSSSTGAVDMFTNDFIMYYEKFLRSGKIGIPAGIFTGNPEPETVEAYYSNGLSKELYLKALENVVNFFNGESFDGTLAGPSYKQYLDYLDTNVEGEELSKLINDQFDVILAQAENLNLDFVEQIENDNTVMLAAFDELQKNVVLLKVDMLQALSISVDYVDTDGD